MLDSVIGVGGNLLVLALFHANPMQWLISKLLFRGTPWSTMSIKAEVQLLSVLCLPILILILLRINPLLDFSLLFLGLGLVFVGSLLVIRMPGVLNLYFSLLLLQITSLLSLLLILSGNDL